MDNESKSSCGTPRADRQAQPASSYTTSFGKLRSFIYDTAIVSFTQKWYREVLESIPENSRLLDVGIGTGAALVANADLVRSKNITVVGVDYDAAYIEQCQDLIVQHDLSQHVSAICCSFYGYQQEKFDHVYFSGSFMILPNGPEALRHAVSLLTDPDTGRLYFTQTFELEKNSLLEWIKPSMTYWTTIDFGKVTYPDEFEKALGEGDTVLVSSTRIQDGKAVDGRRESRLVVARSSIPPKPP